MSYGCAKSQATWCTEGTDEIDEQTDSAASGPHELEVKLFWKTIHNNPRMHHERLLRRWEREEAKGLGIFLSSHVHDLHAVHAQDGPKRVKHVSGKLLAQVVHLLQRAEGLCGTWIVIGHFRR